jgi:hypothetical protein
MQSINQFLGLIKAQQHAYEKRKNRYLRLQPPEPKSFEDWLKCGLEIQEGKGARVELIPTKDGTRVGAIKLDWGTHELIREISDFWNEYQTEYLPMKESRQRWHI